MADLLYVYDVTCAASIAASAAIEVACVSAGLYSVTKVRIVIPDGHSGLTGIALAFGHNPVIPANQGAFISGNDETYDYELGDYPPGVAWSVFLCNNDTQAHIWETRWECNLLTDTPTALPQTPVTPMDIYTAAATAQPDQSDNAPNIVSQ